MNTNARVDAAYTASGTSKPAGISTGQSRLTAVAAWSAPTGAGYARTGSVSLPAWPPAGGDVAAWLTSAANAYSPSGTANAMSAAVAVKVARSLIAADLRTALDGDMSNVLNGNGTTTGILPRLATTVAAYRTANTPDQFPAPDRVVPLSALVSAVDGLYSALGWERSAVSDSFVFGFPSNDTSRSTDAVSKFGRDVDLYWRFFFGPDTSCTVPMTKEELDLRLNSTDWWRPSLAVVKAV